MIDDADDADDAHPVSTPLALILGRLNVLAAANVVVGQIAPPRDAEEDRRHFAWVRVLHGTVFEIDEIETAALQSAGAQAGTVPRCEACGEVVDYGNPIDAQRDAWNCADDGPFVYDQGRVEREADGSSASLEGDLGPSTDG